MKKYLTYYLAMLFQVLLYTNINAQWVTQISNVTVSLQSTHFVSETQGFAVGSNKILKTTNSGAIWNVSDFSPTSLEDIYFIDETTGWICGGGSSFNAMIAKTTNGGEIWAYTNFSALDIFYSVYFVDQNTGYCVGRVYGPEYSYLYKTTNGGINWSQIYSSSPEGITYTSVHFINNNLGFLVGETRIARTTNGGSTWSFTNTPSILNEIYFVNDTHGWIAGNNGTVMYSTDSGVNWTNSNTGTTQNLGSIYFTDVNNGFAVGGNGTILSTTNGGNSWIEENIVPPTTNGLTSVHFPSSVIGWAVGANGTILKRESNITIVLPNGGEQWVSGNQYDITWTDNISENVKIELYKGGVFNSPIIGSTPSDGLYSWQIPISQVAGSDYKVRITSINTSSFYDESNGNFTVNNPLPTTMSISPTSANVGSPAFTMTVNGTGFVNGSVVRFSGSDRTTTYVTPTQLTAQILASDLGTAGTYEIRVFNSTPGGGLSNAQTFTVNNPLPTTTSISPNSKTVGDPAFTMTVNGTGFVNGSVVRFSGSDRTTTYVNPTLITAQILASDLSTAGTYEIRVFNSTPGGGLSNAQTFTVNNPLPTTMSISPTSANVGSPAFTMTVNGTGFVNGSVVRFSGNDRATTYVSPTQLTAQILASDLGTAGTYEIRVFNSAPGGGLSNAQTFTVNNPLPTTTSISPTSANVGSPAFTMTVNGTGFVNGSVVRFSGSDRTTTYVTPTQLTAQILASDLSTAGTYEIRVFNSTPGGGLSNAQTFTVNNPLPTTMSISPTSANVGSPAFTMTVNGTGFVNGSVVRFSGNDRATTYVSPTQLTAQILASDLGTAGTYEIRVFNSAPGGGLSNAQIFTVSNLTDPYIDNISPDHSNLGDPGFTMTVNGSNFVSGSVVRFNGSNRTTTYVNQTQLTAQILASDLDTSGVYGISVLNPPPGGGVSNVVNFTVNNPLPTTTSISPTSATVGSPAFTMTVNGTGFVNGSVVRFSGSDRTTTYVTPTQLTAQILASDLGTAGTYEIRVFNSTPGGGVSNAQTFTVNNPLPTTTSISPTSANVGSQGFQMTVNGTGFVNGSVVRFAGSDRTTTYVTPTQLTAQILASDLDTSGVYGISVLNPPPGGGVSNVVNFTVNNLTDPYIDNISPDSCIVGSPGFTMTVNGSNFVSGSEVRFNGSNRTTTYVNPTLITAQILTSDLTTIGLYGISVSNPPPSGGISNVVNFAVNNPLPTTTSISPTSATVGNPAFTMTVNGTGFVNGSVVRFAGSDRATTYVTPTQLTAQILASDLGTAGTYEVRVFNSAPGGGLSNAQTFTVNDLAPIINISPQSLAFGQVQVNQSSDKTFQIKNEGNVILEVSSITSSNPTVFSVNLSSATIQPGNSQNITVTFAPTQVTTYNGIITIVHNASGSPSQVSVSGEGIENINYPDTINIITNYSFGNFTQTSSYKIIGIPGNNNLPIGNFISGTPGKEGDWRAFWDPGTGSYTEYSSGSSTFYFKPGRAFWVLSKNAINISLTDVPTVILAGDNTYSIQQLHNEWNLISNPFEKTIPWSDVQNINGITDPIHYYQSGSYDSTTNSFEPYKGYYFFNRNSGLTNLKIPYVSAGEGPMKKQQIEITRELGLVLSIEGENKIVIKMGFLEEANSGLDKLDIFSPPSNFCELNLALYNEELETNYKYLKEEYRAEIGEGQEFEIKLKNTTGKSIELTAEGIESFAEYELYLLDKRLNKLYNLKEQNIVQVKRTVTNGDYSLLVGTESYILEKKSNLLPGDYVLYQNYPNPFNPITTIRFSIPKNEIITLSVYNILGELVKEVIKNQQYEAGYYEVELDGRSLSSGVYIYKLEAGSFIETKKMVLLR